MTLEKSFIRKGPESSFKNQVARTVFVLCHLDGTDVMVDSNLNVFQPTRRSE